MIQYIPEGTLFLITYGEADSYTHVGLYQALTDIPTQELQDQAHFAEVSETFSSIGDYLVAINNAAKINIKELNISESGKVRYYNA